MAAHPITAHELREEKGKGKHRQISQCRLEIGNASLTGTESRKVSWRADIQVAHPDVRSASNRVDKSGCSRSLSSRAGDMQVDRLV